MSRKVREIKETRGSDAVRQDIRNYIRNERETMLVKWLSLEQSIKSEDRARDDFLARKSHNDTKILPLNVVKFIGTMKKSVHKIIRHKGGSLPSIVRNMFLYWDADKSGQISGDELFACMKSLGVNVTRQQCNEIVSHYQSQKAGEMDYRELLEDIQKNEPTLTQNIDYDQTEQDKNEIRFEDRDDRFGVLPASVKLFIDAVQEYVNKELRERGGTPEQILRRLVKTFDYTYSGGLAPNELIRAARRKLKLVVNEQQSKEIVAYYDRKNTGELDAEAFTKDVCKEVKPILTFTELTPETIENSKKALKNNPYMPVPFAAASNRVLEKFKGDVNLVLRNKVKSVGGTVTSWVREAFVKYDPGFTSKLTTTDQLIGAVRRLGVFLSENDARVLMKLYDVNNTGEMHYNYLAQELMKESGDMFTQIDGPETVHVPSATQRAPLKLQEAEDMLKTAVNKFVRVSKGTLVAKDVFHGTLARFDTNSSGRIGFDHFKAAMKELRVKDLKDGDLILFMKWFDTNGSQELDYNAMSRQFFGSDITTEEMTLPDMREPTRYSQLVNAARTRPTLFGVMPESKAATTLSSFASTAGVGSAKENEQANRFRTVNSSGTGIMSLLNPTGYGVSQKTMEKNLEKVESKAIKNARMRMKRNKIIEEKRKVERKLASIEKQRKTIINDLKTRRSQSA